MEQLGKVHQDRIQEVCPACGMPRSQWSKAVEVGGTQYCCTGCADGTGCTCPQKAAAQAETGKVR